MMSNETHTFINKSEIGEVPSDWEVNKLAYLVEKIKLGGTPKSTKKEYYNGKVPFVKIEDITSTRKYLTSTKKRISEEGLNNSNAWLVPEGSLLYSIYATVGEVVINKIPVATNQAILNIIPNKKINVDYLYYFFQGIKNNLSVYFKETTQKNLTAQIVKDFQISVPPLSEQHKIASILSKVDEQLEQTEQVIEKTELLKEGLMQKLLTKGIGHTKFKKTELGEIPEEWEIVKVNAFCDVKTGGTPSTKNKDYWDGDILWMSSGEINKKFIYDTDKKITEQGLENSNARILPKDTVMMALNGQGKTRGTVAVLKILSTCNQSLACLIPDKNKSHYLYLYYNLQKRYSEIRNITGDTGREGLNLKILKDILIPLPKLEEQLKIASILSKVDSQIQDNQSYLTRLRELKKGLMQDLLTGKVRVCA